MIVLNRTFNTSELAYFDSSANILFCLSTYGLFQLILSHRILLNRAKSGQLNKKVNDQCLSFSWWVRHIGSDLVANLFLATAYQSKS